MLISPSILSVKKEDYLNNYIEIDRNIKNTPINEAMQNIIGTIFPSLKHIYFSYFKYAKQGQRPVFYPSAFG